MRTFLHFKIQGHFKASLEVTASAGSLCLSVVALVVS